MKPILGNIPSSDFGIACSGGSDSMAALGFLCNNGARTPFVFFFHHGIPEDDAGLEVVHDYCQKNHLSMEVKQSVTPLEKGISKEMFWRKNRYEWLYNLNMPIITAHHLDDVIETWIFGAINGQPKLIPYRTNNIIRPFLLWNKKDLRYFADSRNIHYHDDILNNNLSFSRNRIRHNIIPEILKINPGIGSLLSKKIKEKYEHR